MRSLLLSSLTASRGRGVVIMLTFIYFYMFIIFCCLLLAPQHLLILPCEAKRRSQKAGTSSKAATSAASGGSSSSSQVQVLSNGLALHFNDKKALPTLSNWAKEMSRHGYSVSHGTAMARESQVRGYINHGSVPV
jgi:hypothetical protein